jgi:hypothetical protein
MLGPAMHSDRGTLAPERADALAGNSGAVSSGSASSSGWEFVASFVRTVSGGVAAGMIAGLLVGGVGGRLVMRILALTSASQATGLLTENGNRVGEITLGGTVALLIFGGLFLGAAGGIAYLALRRWLRGPPWLKGLEFGLFLLAVAGPLVLEPENQDFFRLRPRPLAVGMFAALFPLYGLAVAPLAERLMRSFPSLLPPRPALVAYLPLIPGFLVAFPLTIGVAAFGAVAWAVRGSTRLTNALRGRAVDTTAWLLILAGGAVGSITLADAIAEIL